MQCSHYVPQGLSEDAPLPCVIYCHGNSGCRADGNEAAIMLLPSNITLFTLDFSGSGLSDGDYVSLGWHEKEDLKVVVSYLRSLKQITYIGLWGRSMGAVTSLMYAAEDPSIAGMVLDSPFSNLFDLMMELVDVYKIRLPKFTVRVALQIMRRIIQKRAQFDIMDLNVRQLASKTFIPVLFGHANDDIFVQPRHSDIIHEDYAGDKNIIKFEGDHNSPRPQFYYDSVTIFFHNVLCPSLVLPADDICENINCGLDALQIHQGLVEKSFCEELYEPAIIIPRFHNSDEVPDMGGKKEGLPQPMTLYENNDNNSPAHPVEVIELLRRVECNEDSAELSSLDPVLEKKVGEPGGDCYAYPSSNGASTESWGRCSSHGITDNSIDEPLSRISFAEAPIKLDDEEKGGNSINTRKFTANQNSSFKTVWTRKGKFEALSRLKLSCFRGSARRRKGTK